MPTIIIIIINECAYSMECERQKICGDFPETIAFKRYAAKHERKNQYANYSGLPVVNFLRSMHRKAPELPSDCQRHSALSKLMPLARVGARTDNTTSTAQKREAWPIPAHTHWRSIQDDAPRVCTLVLFIVL